MYRSRAAKLEAESPEKIVKPDEESGFSILLSYRALISLCFSL